MSYAASAALQGAVFQRLSGWSSLAGVSVVDAVPPGTGRGTFILLGSETVVDQSDKSGLGAEHQFVVSVISDATGFIPAKTAAGHVSEALVGASLTLVTGSLVSLSFLRAAAKRLNTGDSRRIDLTFRARIEL